MKRSTFFVALTVALAALAWPHAAEAQTSSLYLEEVPAPPQGRKVRDPARLSRLSPAIVRVSLMAVPLPEPRQFILHDQVTIIIRESTENKSKSQLDTEKKINLNGEVGDFPQIIGVNDLANLILRNPRITNDPKLKLTYDNKYQTDGQMTRSDTFTSRMSARIIDIKPNGTLVLEGRTFIKTDGETLAMVITGTCRREDVSADNSVLSTQLFDLRLVKEHTGQLRKVNEKGLITRIFETLFNF